MKHYWIAAWFLVSISVAAGKAHAYSLSRMPSSEVETGFFNAVAALWVPMSETFADNHQLSSNYVGEFGFRVASAQRHHFFVIGSLSYSPQVLRSHLASQRTDVLFGAVGMRYVPGSLCTYEGTGCPFAELAIGVTSESATPELSHDAVSGQLTVSGGIGYRFWLGRAFQLGARIDTAYLEENYVRRLGWITPSLFLGLGF